MVCKRKYFKNIFISKKLKTTSFTGFACFFFFKYQILEKNKRNRNLN